MTIPFTKAHGAKNDFLLTWSADAPKEQLVPTAIAICNRHTGVGADGWMLVTRMPGPSHASIRLFNSDGSEAELSGNGTRCAAALLIDAGEVTDEIRIETGAGQKSLRLLSREGNAFQFEMDMGTARIRDEEIHFPLETSGGEQDVTILNVGNPQCAMFVTDLNTIDWRRLGAEIEKHQYFTNRTNVSFVRVIDENTIDVRFYERGAGETMSSGTGSTGAAAAAIVRGLAKSPVTVLTPAGPLSVRRDGQSFFLAGPAEIIAKGEFYL